MGLKILRFGRKLKNEGINAKFFFGRVTLCSPTGLKKPMYTRLASDRDPPAAAHPGLRLKPLPPHSTEDEFLSCFEALWGHKYWFSESNFQVSVILVYNLIKILIFSFLY